MPPATVAVYNLKPPFFPIQKQLENGWKWPQLSASSISDEWWASLMLLLELSSMGCSTRFHSTCSVCTSARAIRQRSGWWMLMDVDLSFKHKRKLFPNLQQWLKWQNSFRYSMKVTSLIRKKWLIFSFATPSTLQYETKSYKIFPWHQIASIAFILSQSDHQNWSKIHSHENHDPVSSILYIP